MTRTTTLYIQRADGWRYDKTVEKSVSTKTVGKIETTTHDCPRCHNQRLRRKP